MVLSYKDLTSFTFDCPSDSRVTGNLPRLLKTFETFSDSLEVLKLLLYSNLSA